MIARWPILALFIFVLVPLNSARSGEFGNIIDPKNDKTEQQARAASAKILQSLQRLFRALEQSELKRIPARREALSAAASLLFDAAKDMSSIDTQNLRSVAVSYEKISAQDRNLLVRISGGPPKEIADLYSRFEGATVNFAKVLSELARSERDILPSLQSDLTAYLDLGFAVSRVAQVSQI